MTTVVDLPRRKAASTSEPETDSKPADGIIEAFLPHNLRWGNVDWVVAIFLVSMHLGCLAAPFFFSWTGLIVCVVLHWLTASIGICLGYHRYLSHRSFKLAKPAEAVVLTCGALSGEGSPLRWAATHRLHHQKSDQVGDPHSPLDGPWWSHLWWLFPQRPENHGEQLYERYVPELLDNSTCQFLERHFGKTSQMQLSRGWNPSKHTKARSWPAVTPHFRLLRMTYATAHATGAGRSKPPTANPSPAGRKSASAESIVC